MERLAFLANAFAAAAMGGPKDSRPSPLTLREGFPSLREADQLSAFDASRNVLVLKTGDLSRIFLELEDGSARAFFYEGHPFYDRVRRFITDNDNFRGWRQPGGDLFPRLHDVDKSSVRGLLGNGQETLPFYGVPVVGWRQGEGTIWLALMPFEAFVLLSKDGYPTPEAIAEYYAPTVVARFPVPDRLAWLAHSGASETLDILARFTGSRDFCAELFQEIREAGRPGSEVLQPKSFAAIFNTGRRSGKDIDGLCAAWSNYVAHAGDRTLVVVFLLLGFEEAVRLLDAAVPVGTRAGHRILILDREAVLDHLSWLPWWWSRWTSRAGEPRLARGKNDQDLRDALLPAPMAAHLRGHEPARHPALTPNLPPSFLISGREGTGKSTAVWEVCRERKVDLVIVVHAGLDEPSLVLGPLFADLPRLGLRSIIWVIEDLHLDVERSVASTYLAFLLRLALHANRSGMLVVNVLATCWSGESPRVRQTYRGLFANIGLIEVNLDPLPQEFAATLIEHACQSFDVTLKDKTPADLATVFQHHAATPYAIMLYFRDQQGKQLRGIDLSHAAFGAGWQYWRDQYLALEQEGRRQEQALLLLIAILRHLRMLRITTRAVEAIFLAWKGHSASDFLLALQHLKTRYWVRDIDGALSADDQQLADHVFAFSDEEYGRVLDELAPHLVGFAANESTHEHFRMLRGLGHEFKRRWQFDRSREYLRAALALVAPLPQSGLLCATLHYELGTTELLRTDLQAAIRESQLAIKGATANDAPQERIGLFEYQLGSLLMITEQNSKAAEYLGRGRTHMTSRDFMFIACSADFGLVLLQLGRQDESRQILREIEQLEIPERNRRVVETLRQALNEGGSEMVTTSDMVRGTPCEVESCETGDIVRQRGVLAAGLRVNINVCETHWRKLAPEFGRLNVASPSGTQ